MRLTRLTIDNIKGIEHIELQPGALTVIRGANGSGKSSIIDAPLAVFGGGCDPGWLRNGSQKGSIVMEISDDEGNLAATITKTISRRRGGSISATLEILDPNGVPIPAPQTFVAKLGEAWAVDPSSLLTLDASTAAGKKALIQKLLEIMPIRFERDELALALSGVSVNGIDILSGTDLDGLAKARKYVEEMRKRVGVEQREADGAVTTLKKSLPEEDSSTDWSAQARELEQQRGKLTARESRERAEVTAAGTVEREAINTDFAGEERTLREEFQQKLSALATRKQERLAKLYDAEASRFEQIRVAIKPESDRLTSALSVACERATQQTKAQGVRDSIATFEQKAGAKFCEYNDLTDTLERLDDLKKTKLDSLPVPLKFEGDTVLYNGVEWHHINTAQRGLLAFQICALRAGKLQFLVADDAEHFDDATWSEFQEAAIASGFQVIAAKVDAGPLTVERVA